MTLKQVIRTLEKSARAADRQAASSERDAQKHALASYQAAVKQHQYAEAAASAYAYENYVRALVTYHHVGLCGVGWNDIANAASPPAPQAKNDMERGAVAAIEGYKPALLDRVLGRNEAKRAELEQAAVNARTWDAKMFQDAQQAHAAAMANWQSQRNLAWGVINRDVSIYQELLDAYGIPTAFQSLGYHTTVDVVESNLISFKVFTNCHSVIPNEEVKVTKSGKLSTKQMAKGRYFELLQDHFCSCALRLACDTFNALLVDRVIVNIGENQVNAATGHNEHATLIGVHFTRDALTRINVYQVDPSTSMQNFNCRMNFRKTKGLLPVEPITSNDQWVTT